LGWDVAFSVSATSILPMSYQWQFNGVSLAGATNASLVLTNVENAQAGAYAVVVSNAIGGITSRTAVLSVSAPLPPSLVGLWRFDEGSGDQALDSSGLANHGVLATDGGSIPVRVQGQAGFGTALELQYDGVNHSYVDIPADDSLKFGMTANATWTICAWAYEGSDGAGGFVSSYGRLFAQNGGYGLNFNSGSTLWNDPQFFIWHHSLGAWQQEFGVNAAVVPLLDQWVHLALVYDGQSLTLYRNGNQGALGAKTSLPVRASLDWSGYGSGIQIGTMLNMGGDRNWNGMIDDFTILTGALTESQVRTVMTGGFSAFLKPHPQLSIASSGGRVVLTWSWGVLQSAPDITGAWQDEADAFSPLALPPAEARRFYRVRR
jgi:hypothetical protein